jgi:ABC-type bacteriocin/lantibiotic exporter with double-glycine peptidase domain
VVLQIAVGTVLLAVYHPLLLVFALVLGALVGLLLLGGGRGVKTSIKESKAKYAVAAWLEEIARHRLTFRGASTAAYAVARAERLTVEYLGARRAHYKILFRQVIGALALQAAAASILLAFGGALVLGGRLTLGQLVAAELILTSVLAGVGKLGKYLESYYDLTAAVDKLGHLVDLPLEGGGEEAPLATGGMQLAARGVSVAYVDGAEVLSEIDLDVPGGARVAILGANGAGKTSLIDVLAGLRAPASGTLEIDGINTRELDLARLRDDVALVRGVEIFEGTVADNVRVGRPQVTLDDVRRALDQVGLREAIAALPAGIQSELSTGAPVLSQGQARRLMLARAIAGRPRLVLLDEALDDLDATAREDAWRLLFDAGAPWTLVVATHALETIRGCDQAYVLEQGRIRPLAPARMAS